MRERTFVRSRLVCTASTCRRLLICAAVCACRGVSASHMRCDNQSSAEGWGRKRKPKLMQCTSLFWNWKWYRWNRSKWIEWAGGWFVVMEDRNEGECGCWIEKRESERRPSRWRVECESVRTQMKADRMCMCEIKGLVTCRYIFLFFLFFIFLPAPICSVSLVLWEDTAPCLTVFVKTENCS